MPIGWERIIGEVMAAMELDYASKEPRGRWWHEAWRYVSGGGTWRLAGVVAMSTVALLGWVIYLLPGETQATNSLGHDPEIVVPATRQVMREQIERYRKEHGGKPPPQTGFVSHMCSRTDAAGKVLGPAATGEGFGPYIGGMPGNSFNGKQAVGAFADPSFGWVYTVSRDAYTFEAVDETGTKAYSK